MIKAANNASEPRSAPPAISAGKQARPRKLQFRLVSGACILVCSVIGIAIVGTHFYEALPASQGDLERYRELVCAVGEPLYAAKSEFRWKSSLEDEYTEVRRIVDAIKKEPENHSLQSAWNSLLPSVKECAATLDRIAEVEKKKPADVDTTMSVIASLWEVFEMNNDTSSGASKEHANNAWNVSKGFRDRLQAEINAPKLRTQYREARLKLREDAAHLFELKSHFKIGSRTKLASSSGSVLCDAFSDSLNESFADDCLQLTNHTGRTLHQCVLLVSCESDSSHIDHIHYKDRWEGDQTFFAIYHIGDDFFHYANALDGTQRVRLKLVSNEVELEEVFPYTDSARVRNAETDLKDFHFSMTELPYQNLLGWENHHGAAFSFVGPSRLVPSRITLTMINSKVSPQRTEIATIEGSPWSPGEEKSIRDKRFDNFNGETFSLELEFPHTNFRPKFIYNNVPKQ